MDTKEIGQYYKSRSPLALELVVVHLLPHNCICSPMALHVLHNCDYLALSRLACFFFPPLIHKHLSGKATHPLSLIHTRAHSTWLVGGKEGRGRKKEGRKNTPQQEKKKRGGRKAERKITAFILQMQQNCCLLSNINRTLWNMKFFSFLQQNDSTSSLLIPKKEIVSKSTP